MWSSRVPLKECVDLDFDFYSGSRAAWGQGWKAVRNLTSLNRVTLRVNQMIVCSGPNTVVLMVFWPFGSSDPY